MTNDKSGPLALHIPLNLRTCQYKCDWLTANTIEESMINVKSLMDDIIDMFKYVGECDQSCGISNIFMFELFHWIAMNI